MVTIKLSLRPHNFDSCKKCDILIGSNHIGKFCHDIRKSFQNLNISLFGLFVAKDKTKWDNFFRSANSRENTDSPSFAIVVSFLNNVVGEVESHPVAKVLEVILHEWADNDHQIRKLVHLGIVGVVLNFVLFLVQQISQL